MNRRAEKVTHMTAEGRRESNHVVRALRWLEAIEGPRDRRVAEAREILLDYVDNLSWNEKRRLEAYFGAEGIPVRPDDVRPSQDA